MNTLVKHNGRDLFRDLFSPMFWNGFESDTDSLNQTNHFVPAANITENDKAFNLEIALPGYRKEDVALDVKEHLLTVKGSFENKTTEEDETIHRSEISKGSFSRSFRLGEKVNLKKIEAKMENGILHVSIPKKEAEKPVKVTIK